MKITNFGPNGQPVILAGWSTGYVSLNSNVEIAGGGLAALNFVQLITANGSNGLTRPIANFSAGSNIVLSATSNTMTITSLGGGVAGIQSNGSNSLTGLVNLQAGSGIALTVSGQNITITNTSGGSGSALGWNLDVSQPGTSFTGWTARDGTWSSNGTEIIQTDTAGSVSRVATFDTLVPLGYGAIIEAEVYVDTGTTANQIAGIIVSDSASNNGIMYFVDHQGDILGVDRDVDTAYFTLSTTLAIQTWYKLRMVIGGSWASLYLDGVLKGNILLPVATFRVSSDRVGLVTYSATGKFRNFKVWTLSTGAPA